MTKQRSVDTKFWSDPWVRKLNPLDRYLFLFLLTNERSSWCGVYELDLSIMAFESGLDERDLEKSMLPRLSEKVVYVDGWVCFKNWEKYHNNGSEQTKKGIENAWKAVPEKIRLKLKKLSKNNIPPIDPLQGNPSSTSSFTSTITSSSTSKDATKVAYGEFQNVLLTESEHQKLVAMLGDSNTQALIFDLSAYVASNGKRYKSHYATLLAWAKRKLADHKTKKIITV